MPNIDEEANSNVEPTSKRVRLTVQLSLNAYDALSEIQRQHRRQTGRKLPLWKLVDAAVIAYARQKEIDTRD